MSTNLTAAAIKEEWPDCDNDGDHYFRILLKDYGFCKWRLSMIEMLGKWHVSIVVSRTGESMGISLPLTSDTATLYDDLDQLRRTVAFLRGEGGAC